VAANVLLGDLNLRIQANALIEEVCCKESDQYPIYSEIAFRCCLSGPVLRAGTGPLRWVAEDRGLEPGRASSPLTLLMVLLMEVAKGVLGLVLRVLVF
jgi:hypothetical protein